MYREVVFTCTTVLARAVSQVPLRLYVVKPKGKGKGKLLYETKAISHHRRNWLMQKEGLQPWLSKGDIVEEVGRDHPFYKLFDIGNPFMSRYQLLLTMQKHIDLVGEAFVHVETMQGQGKGLPIALHLLLPHSMSIFTDERTRTLKGYRQKWTDANQKQRTDDYVPEEIMRPYTPDPIQPLRATSPLEAMGLEAEMYHNMNIYDLALMKNGGVPSTVLVFPEGVGEPERQRIERRYNRRHTGPHNAGRIATVSGQFDLKTISLSQKDMEFPEGRKVARDQIANGFGVPISILTETSTYSNAQVGLFLLAEHGVKPRLVIIQDTVNRTVIPMYDDPQLFAAFDDPTPENKELKIKRATLMLRTDRTVRKGELRAELDLNADAELDEELVERPRLNQAEGGTSRPINPGAQR